MHSGLKSPGIQVNHQIVPKIHCELPSSLLIVKKLLFL